MTCPFCCNTERLKASAPKRRRGKVAEAGESCWQQDYSMRVAHFRQSSPHFTVKIDAEEAQPRGVVSPDLARG